MGWFTCPEKKMERWTNSPPFHPTVLLYLPPWVVSQHLQPWSPLSLPYLHEWWAVSAHTAWAAVQGFGVPCSSLCRASGTDQGDPDWTAPAQSIILVRPGGPAERRAGDSNPQAWARTAQHPWRVGSVQWEPVDGGEEGVQCWFTFLISLKKGELTL